jgi:multicomponent K+:H+ antiporter subunit A
MFMMVVAAIGVAAAAIWQGGITWGYRERMPADPAFALLWAAGLACAVAVALLAKFHRLAALILLGAVGLVVSVTFLWFSAPDLALTQLAVETVTTILLLLGLRWLPKRARDEEPQFQFQTRLRRARDLVVAVLAGCGMATLAYAMMTRPTPQSLAPFYIGRALPEGGGANVVNVILVDFRGFDTMGEICVLTIVGLTVYALLRRFRPPQEVDQLPPQQRLMPADLVSDLDNPRTAADSSPPYLVVPAAFARLLLPVSGLIALYLFLRGHNQPGGGFVAALVVSAGFIMQYMVAGTRWVEARLRLPVLRWMGAGLLLAVATGLGAMALGYPFLTTHTAHFDLPLLGQVHLASALFFDLGVFAVVVGSTLLVLTALAHQSVRGRRPAIDAGATD